MAYLFNRNWTRNELNQYFGNLDQVAGVRLAEWTDGKERGLRVAEVRSGSGLDFSLLLDRGMDIGPASYKGTPLAWLSPVGFAHPMYYEPTGLGWLRTFGGGLLTGCGLTSVGSPEEDQGESLGQHGRLSHLPAERVSVSEEWQGDECTFRVQGEMRQVRFFGENLSLKRSVSVALGGSRIALHDVVENLASEPSPLMVLYHINLGCPLLDETSELLSTPHAVIYRDEVAAAGREDWMRFQPPTPGYAEQVFYHNLPADSDGWAAIQLANRRRKLGLTIRFQKATLPNLVQWKQMGQGAYVLGLEPSNCWVGGRSKERTRGTLQTIQPGEQREFRVEIEVSEIA